MISYKGFLYVYAFIQAANAQCGEKCGLYGEEGGHEPDGSHSTIVLFFARPDPPSVTNYA
eukprot:scaffold53813_cov83-Cyclotella_meneghiniana.AAC.2